MILDYILYATYYILYGNYYDILHTLCYYTLVVYIIYTTKLLIITTKLSSAV